MNDIALEIENVSKSFGPVQVLRGVSLKVRRGSVLGLCGENGAGKSTLLRIVSGALRPDSGSVSLFGTPASRGAPQSPDDSRGRSRSCHLVPQEFALVPGMTAAENLFLGHELSRHGLLRRREMRERAAELFARTGARVDPDAAVSSLGVADRQKIEIARAFLEDAALLLFDEPTTVLDTAETAALFDTIRAYTARGGSAVYVSHKLDEVLDICDQIVVLRDGSPVASGPSSKFTPASLAESMVGRPLSRLYPPRLAARGRADDGVPALEVRDLSSADGRVRRASLSVWPGEIVGVAGLAGAGRTELCETVCGLRRRGAGQVLLNGRAARFSGMDQALRAGVAFVPEDRQGAGLLHDFAIDENIGLAGPGAPHRGPFVDFRARVAQAERFAHEFHLKCESVHAPARSLSGGNQQKVVLSKALAAGPRVLIVDEPTRGVDVGARAEIYEIVREMALRGAAVLLVSSDLGEAIGLSSRLYVMHDGEIAGCLPGASATEESVMRLAHGIRTTAAGTLGA